MLSRILKLLGLAGLVACCVSLTLISPDTADAQSYRMECSPNGSCKLVPIAPAYSSPAYYTPAPAYSTTIYAAPPRPTYSFGVGFGVYSSPVYYAPSLAYRAAPPRYYAASPLYAVRTSMSTCGNPLCRCGNCPCGPSCACGY